MSAKSIWDKKHPPRRTTARPEPEPTRLLDGMPYVPAVKTDLRKKWQDQGVFDRPAIQRKEKHHA